MLIVSIVLGHPAKTLVWAAALVWLGVACLLNARRCGRLHCFVTGPYFLGLALAALLHGYQVVWLGPNGWIYLGVAFAVGGYGLWVVPERLWGKYYRSKMD